MIALLGPILAALGPVLKPLFDALLPFVWGLLNAPNTAEDGAANPLRNQLADRVRSVWH